MAGAQSWRASLPVLLAWKNIFALTACDKRQRIYVNTLIDYGVLGVNTPHAIAPSLVRVEARVAQNVEMFPKIDLEGVRSH